MRDFKRYSLATIDLPPTAIVISIRFSVRSRSTRRNGHCKRSGSWCVLLSSGRTPLVRSLRVSALSCEAVSVASACSSWSLSVFSSFFLSSFPEKSGGFVCVCVCGGGEVVKEDLINKPRICPGASPRDDKPVVGFSNNPVNRLR